MAKIESRFRCDLKRAVQVQTLNGNVFSMDAGGNTIVVEVFEDGEPVALGGSVSGYAILANGVTVPLPGSVSENKATVTVIQSALAVPGTIRIAVKWTDGTVITTLLALVSTVYRTMTDSIVTPDPSVISDWSAEIAAELADCATARTNLAGIVAPAFAEGTANAAGTYVTKDGNLYLLPIGHTAGTTWSNTTKTQVTAGGQISDLKNAMYPINTNSYIMIGQNTDLDTLLTPCVYRVPNTTYANSLVNAPKNITGPVGVIVIWDSYTTNRINQTYYIPKNGELLQFTRFYNGSAWSEWEALGFDRNDFQDDGITIKVTNLSSGYYSTSNGKVASSSEWRRTRYLIPVTSDITGCSFITENLSNSVYIMCYDANEAFLRYIQTPSPNIIMSDVKYIALCHHFTDETITIKRRVAVDNIQYPFNDPNTFLRENRWCNNGSVEDTDNYDCLFVAGLSGGEKYYSNNTAAVVICCFGDTYDNNTNYLGNATSVDAPNHGKVYTLLANTRYIYFNISHSATHGNMSDVLFRVTKGKVLCIGDSITYLDGRTNTSYDGASLFLGYQKVLSKAGFEVVSAGFSGYTYATGVYTSGGTEISIYNEIVTNQYDVSGYEYIVLAGGTNDDLHGVPVGTIPDEYDDYDYDTTTMLGALAGIIKYIRDNNETCKIILCTMPKSNNTTRKFSESKLYAEGLRQMSLFASCCLCDLYINMNVQPFSEGWSDYFYDGTHPNKAGMERLGKLVLNAINTY